MKRTVTMRFKGGFNADIPPFELPPDVFSDVINVVSKDGLNVRAPGIQQQASGSVQPDWLQHYENSNGTSGYFVAYSNSLKAYATNSLSTASTTEITRRTELPAIVSITRVGTTATVTFATAHGRTTGDLISVWGASPSQYNVNSVACTVTGATTLTYTMASDPGASADPVGLASYDGATSDFTVTSTTSGGRPTGGVYNGFLLFNHPLNGLYYWDGDTSKRLRKVPLASVARVSRPYKSFIFQLGPTVNGAIQPRRIQWSASAEYGQLPAEFTGDEDNNAGGQELEGIGDLVDCLPLGDALIVYGTTGAYAAQFTEGSSVFTFTRLRLADGLFSRHCVVDTPLGHVFLSKDFDVILFDGVNSKSLNQGRVKSLTGVSGSALLDTYNFVTVNPAGDEVWVCLVTGSVTSRADRVLIWNWKDDAWGKKVPQGTTLTAATVGLTQLANGTCMIVGEAAGDAIGIAGNSVTSDFGTAYASTLERTGIDAGDYSRLKSLHATRWRFKITHNQTISIYHGSMQEPDGAVTYNAAVTLTQNTQDDWLYSRAPSGRYLATKAVWTPTNVDSGKLRSVDLLVTDEGSL